MTTGDGTLDMSVFPAPGHPTAAAFERAAAGVARIGAAQPERFQMAHQCAVTTGVRQARTV